MNPPDEIYETEKEYFETSYPQKLAFMLDSSPNTRRKITFSVYKNGTSQWVMTVYEDEIVQDSFYLEENMCVGDELKFGQTNSNVLKFQTIKKVPIGTYISINYSAEFFEKAYKEEGEGKLWNGVGVNGFRYHVEECNLIDKNAGIYEVVAYGKSDKASYQEYESNEESFESWKNKQVVFADIQAKLSIKGILANIFSFSSTNEETIEAKYSSSNACHTIYTYAPYPIYEYRTLKIYYETIELVDTSVSSDDYYGAPYDALYQIKGYKSIRNYKEAFREINSRFYKNTNVMEHSDTWKFDTLTEKEWLDCILNGFEPFVSYYVDYYDSKKENISSFYKIRMGEYNDSEYIYPAGALGSKYKTGGAHTTYRIVIPTRVEYTEAGPDSQTIKYQRSYDFKTGGSSPIIIERKKITNPEEEAIVYSEKKADNAGGGTSYKTSDFLSAKLELEGKFGFFDLSGYTYYNKLNRRNVLFPQDSGVYPSNTRDRLQGMSIDRHLYSDIEVGEKTTPYGYVRVKYLGTNKETYETTIQIGTGENVYMMTDNALLLNYMWIYEDLKTYIINNFAHVSNYSYYPVKLSVKGLGFIQAGDEIMVETDKGWINTFVMSRTLTGDKYLKDEIVASDMPINRKLQTWIDRVDFIERG